MIICLYWRGILGMECTICIIYIVFGPQGPLIEPSIPSTRPPTTIFLFLLLLLILLSPPPSPWGGLLLLLLLQMIIRRDHPLANDHPDQPDSSPFFFLFFSEFIIFLRQTFCLLLQILGSRLNLADLFRTMCSRFSG